MSRKQETVTVELPAFFGDTPRHMPVVEHNMNMFNKIARWKARHSHEDFTKIERRREAEIQAYVGLNGHGKTLCMIRDTLPTLAGIEWDCQQPDHAHTAKGINHGVRHVLSTVRIYDPITKEPHPLFIPLESLDQLADFEHGDLLLDEIVGVAHSRDSGSLPAQIHLKLQQLRKADVTVRWSAPDYSRADKIIRECTKAVTLCEGGMPDRTRETLWKPNRYFEFHTYAGKDFDEFSAKRAQKLDPLAKEYFWAPRSPWVLDSYDSLESVFQITAVDDHGLCMGCGGLRRRQECSCHDYLHGKALRAEKVKEAKSAPSLGDTAPVVAFQAS